MNIEHEKSLRIEKKYPAILEDISLLKNILTPLELYLLKQFIINESPQTIRDIQVSTLRLIYNAVFMKSIKSENDSLLLLLLKKEGYGIGNLESDHESIKKVIDAKTLHDEVKKKTEALRKYKIKTPSYDLIQSILNDFLNTGIVKKRARDENSEFYLLNPEFIIIFKSKFNQILKL